MPVIAGLPLFYCNPRANDGGFYAANRPEDPQSPVGRGFGPLKAFLSGPGCGGVAALGYPLVVSADRLRVNALTFQAPPTPSEAPSFLNSRLCQTFDMGRRTFDIPS